MPSGKKRKRHKMSTHKRKKRLRKNRHKKEDRMALLLQKQSQPAGLLLTPLGHMLTPATRNTLQFSFFLFYLLNLYYG